MWLLLCCLYPSENFPLGQNNYRPSMKPTKNLTSSTKFVYID